MDRECWAVEVSHSDGSDLVYVDWAQIQWTLHDVETMDGWRTSIIAKYHAHGHLANGNICHIRDTWLFFPLN